MYWKRGAEERSKVPAVCADIISALQVTKQQCQEFLNE
jgi:hypothetical protein